MKYQYENIRSAEYSNERNDCTVNALAKVADLPYGAAYRYTELAGRRKNHGMFSRDIVKMWANGTLANYKVTEIPVGFSQTIRGGVQRPTLADIRRRFPKGRYYVIATGHAIAMKDGVILDSESTAGARKRVLRLFHFEPL